MICPIHKIHMNQGTSYDGKNQRRYDECPKCHIKRFNKDKNFQAILYDEKRKSKVKGKSNKI